MQKKTRVEGHTPSVPRVTVTEGSAADDGGTVAYTPAESATKPKSLTVTTSLASSPSVGVKATVMSPFASAGGCGLGFRVGIVGFNKVQGSNCGD